MTCNETINARSNQSNQQTRNEQVDDPHCWRTIWAFCCPESCRRKSGKLYRIPIIAEPFQNGFVIALTYGRKVDWYENVAAKGVCSLRWKSRDYQLIHPEFIDREIGLMAFPAVFRSGLKAMGIQDFLRLEIQE